MTNAEMAEAIRNIDMYELAQKTVHDIALDENEKEVAAKLDEHFRNVGRTGGDPNKEIAAFIQKVVNEQLYDAPEEVLDKIFDRGNIGEFDSYEAIVVDKNGLIPYEAAKGGSVERSFIDFSAVTPKTVNLQIDTEITFKDLERNGWKTVAKVTEYAVQAFKMKMFAAILGDIDTAISMGADNYITASSAVTEAAADALSLYVLDRTDVGDGLIVAKSKYIQQMSKLPGASRIASDGMKDEIYKTGFLGDYQGVPMLPISAAKKQADGSAIMPENRVFGFAGKIGALDMKGAVKVLQDENNSKETVNIYIKDFTYAVSFYNAAIENAAKIVIS